MRAGVYGDSKGMSAFIVILIVLTLVCYGRLVMTAALGGAGRGSICDLNDVRVKRCKFSPTYRAIDFSDYIMFSIKVRPIPAIYSICMFNGVCV